MKTDSSPFPHLMLLTQSSLMQPNFSDALEKALRGGARLVQLREREIASAKVLSLAREAKRMCEYFGAQLLINGEPEITREVEAAGVHLREHQSVAKARELLGEKYLVGQSAHSLEAARKAELAGADYLVFGSVFATETHPGNVPAGLQALQKIAGAVSIPVYAIGGISPQNALEALAVGAHGVAVIRAVWQAPQMDTILSQFSEAFANAGVLGKDIRC